MAIKHNVIFVMATKVQKIIEVGKENAYFV